MISVEMDKLTPLNVYTPHARYLFDGKLQDAPPASTIFSSDVDPTVSVTITSKGLHSVTKVDPVSGDMTSVLPIEPNSDVFVEVTPSDIDAEELSKREYTQESLIRPGDNLRHLRTSQGGPKAKEGHQGERTLMACTEFRVIELAVAYDSTFCEDVGGTEELANSAVERVVSAASQIYQQPGLCLKIEIAAIDGYCNPQVDPYASIINFSVSGITREFMRFITNDPVRSSIQRDAFHLFYGGKPGFGSIGFAYLDVLCDTNSGFGVNEITYSTNPALQANLLAHELGHNAGSEHDFAGGQNVMSSFICECPTFSGSSVSQINAHVNSVQCITPEAPSSPTDPPTMTSPTSASPTTASPTSASPTTATPTGKPTTTPPTVNPTGSPTTAPTETPTRAPTELPAPPTTVSPRSPTSASPTASPTGCSRDTDNPTATRPITGNPTQTPTGAPTDTPTRLTGPPTGMPTSADGPIFLADFDDSVEVFTYVPNAFFGVDSNAADYNSGSFDGSAGVANDGALVVSLGGIDGARIFGVSGGWSANFALDQSAPVRLSITFELELGADNDFADYALAVCKVDGQLYGTNGNYFMDYILGDGDGGMATVHPYATAELSLPALGVGIHTLLVGAYLHGKDAASEYATMRIDRVEITYSE